MSFGPPPPHDDGDESGDFMEMSPAPSRTNIPPQHHYPPPPRVVARRHQQQQQPQPPPAHYHHPPQHPGQQHHVGRAAAAVGGGGGQLLGRFSQPHPYPPPPPPTTTTTTTTHGGVVDDDFDDVDDDYGQDDQGSFFGGDFESDPLLEEFDDNLDTPTVMAATTTTTHGGMHPSASAAAFHQQPYHDEHITPSSAASASAAAPTRRHRQRRTLPIFQTFQLQVGESDGRVSFHVTDRYEVQGIIGAGAYATVCSAFDRKLQKRVAIKRIHHVFEKSRVYQKRIFREIRILQHFHHENLVELVDLIPPDSSSSASPFQDIYIVMEYMQSDLRRIVGSPQPLSDEHVQFFMWQLLKAVKCLHSASVLHRDIKPENILVNSDCDLKLCDFGLSRGVNFDLMNPAMSTPYVATRFYRAPELLLLWSHCSKSIDVWSCGCILGELLYRQPIFPGRNYLHQLQLITRVLGTPRAEELVGEQSAKNYVLKLPFSRKIPFARLLPEANPQGVDLLERMLTWNPRRRISVEQALEHPYLATWHNPQSVEPVARVPFNFEFENLIQREDVDLRRLMFDEIWRWNVRVNGYSPPSAPPPPTRPPRPRGGEEDCPMEQEEDGGEFEEDGI